MASRPIPNPLLRTNSPPLEETARVRDVQQVGPANLTVEMSVAADHLGEAAPHDGEVENVRDRQHEPIVAPAIPASGGRCDRDERTGTATTVAVTRYRGDWI
jgi:hypothetical protein